LTLFPNLTICDRFNQISKLIEFTSVVKARGSIYYPEISQIIDIFALPMKQFQTMCGEIEIIVTDYRSDFLGKL
jgi:hypothetical protein